MISDYVKDFVKSFITSYRKFDTSLADIDANNDTVKPLVVTLCGSSKFKDAFIQLNKALTLSNVIVLMPGIWGHNGDEEYISEESKSNLDKLHFSKIDLSDAIIVVNNYSNDFKEEHYIGDSTLKEIEYAKNHHKFVYFLF